MTFGKKLQALRKHHGMTQEGQADELNLSRTTVSRWESGQVLPDIQQVIRLSELFTVSVDYLMYDNLDSASQFRDFQSLRTLFWVCTTINICGMALSLIGWLWARIAFPVVMGLIMSLLACAFFEVLPPKGVDRVMLKCARRRFYASNVWAFLPVPIFAGIELVVGAEHYSGLLPYLIGGAAYILIAAAVTFHLMRQYRK